MSSFLAHEVGHYKRSIPSQEMLSGVLQAGVMCVPLCHI